MISVVIPAHDEEMVIERLIRSLTAGAREGEIEVIVVCNGCSDHTAAVARSCGPTVRVIETDIASKTHALNLGDETALGWPRFYVDADIVLPLGAIRKMADRLNTGSVLAIAPNYKMELTGCSWPVRAFCEINDALPSSLEGIGASCAYGLSKSGRARFDKFPQITADDLFVRIHFTQSERVTLRDCQSIIFAPKNLDRLISIKCRSHFGTWEVRNLYPQLWENKGSGNLNKLISLALRPWYWPQLAVYVYAKLIARLRAMRRLRSGNRTYWERDESSRSARSQPANAIPANEPIAIYHVSAERECGHEAHQD